MAIAELPRRALVYVLAVDLLCVGWLLATARLATPTTRDATVAALLLGCIVLTVEVSRVAIPSGSRLGTVSLDGAWTLSAVVLLSPTAAALVVAAATVYLRIRLAGRDHWYRVIFTVLAMASTYSLASTAYQLTGLPSIASHPSAANLAAVVVCLLGGELVDFVVVGLAIRASDPSIPFLSAIGLRRVGVYATAANLGLAVLVTIAGTVSPLFIVAAIPVVIAVQPLMRYEGLEMAARTDAKTGLMRHETWQQECAVRLSPARDAEDAVIMVDIDHFKRFNDGYGHLAGDKALRTVAGCIAQSIRPQDLVCRFGGEEFAVFLAATSVAEATAVGERIRRAVMLRPAVDAPSSPDNPAPTITVSVGVAAAPGGTALEDLVERADKALYDAKNSGRNQVRQAPGVGGIIPPYR
ncbi:GGDEF domain-containing protein [Planosporangium mesophilum]|uniref:GGDEF domain-containing protein n=1 Tax=Planosporangium mesophilum TaxID=689768 RepID=A0A8J3TH99_9ACTN|nr:GGDEF domain-containing protein [Planosporangium mesophilum]NJC82911.1 GGDEF domain-containing protein [Planosporangium mesophilum]GII24689.1 GGDEF domain-containing protein [Planosporangium mesophilum]